MGGEGSINPTTGLHEYKGIFKMFMSILPIALMIFAPGIGTAVGGFLSGGLLSGAGAAALGGGAIGALSGGITGGWKGALMGGAAGALGGGLGGQLGGSASSALGLGLGKTGQAMLGSGIIGAGVGAAGAGMSGGNVLKGALVGGGVGAAGGAIGSMASGVGTDSAIGLGINRGGQAFGNALTAGFKPKEAAISGGLAGLAAGLKFQTPAEINQAKLNDVNASNKDYSFGNNKNAIDMIGAKPSDAVVNGLETTNNPASMGGGHYQTNYLTGAEEWVPNPAGSSPYDLSVKNNFESTAPSGGYGTYTNGQPSATGEPTFVGDQARISPGLGALASSALTPQSVLGVNPNTATLPSPTASAANTNAFNPGSVLGSNTSIQNTGVNANQTAQTPSTDTSGEFDWKKAALYGAGAAAIGMLGKSMLSSAPAPVQNSVAQLSKQQQEYFNRPNVAWDWDKMQQNATARNMSLPEFMATSWPTIAAGQYNVALKAMGGPLARFARGAGSGRDDTIDAKLSDGEYVIDAETVALLGDGSNKAGAKMLDKMRSEIRAQKGKALARGKISPDAKSPLAYLRGAM